MAQVPDIQKYNTAPPRIGAKARVGFLNHAKNRTVINQFGAQEKLDRNVGKTLIFRRVQPFDMQANGAPGTLNPDDFMLAEGVNPPTYSVKFSDVSAHIKHFGILFKHSKDSELLYEDDIKAVHKKQVGEAMADISEMLMWGMVIGGTVVDYSNGSSRAQVNTPIRLEQLRRATRTLENARASEVTSMLAPSPNYDTSAIEPGYIVFIHTDMEADVEDLPGFVPSVKYGSRQKIHDRELGAVGRYRFITAPHFTYWANAGGAVGTQGVKSTTGTNADVYPAIVMAEEAWGNVALKGFNAVTPVVHPAEPSKADPLGQYGLTGASFWQAPIRLNENWMVRLEAAVSNLA